MAFSAVAPQKQFKYKFWLIAQKNKYNFQQDGNCQMTIRENLSQPVCEETGLLTNYLFPVINIGVCDRCFWRTLPQDLLEEISLSITKFNIHSLIIIGGFEVC